ncbi:MAG: cytochrome c biogenesis protein CcsA, partial [Myxococcota bacterium]|nr:cytochrome c biogenesis protein CcsA [Myxococcota bacterium]
LWSHLHVVLASAGLALVGVAAAAGLLYLAHHRRIKARRRGPWGAALPPLEALDRVNTLALSLGFLLLSLGVLTGVAWVRASTGRFWPGDVHANATLAAWIVYAAMVGLRFGGHQGARRSAVTSAAGFALLLTAVVGVEVLS